MNKKQAVPRVRPGRILRGFTLIELLVVIAIIGILTTIITFSITNLRTKSRDTKRITDIKSIQLSLENYYRDEQSYPSDLNFGSDLIGTKSSTTYMAPLPNNPSPQADGACTNDDYAYQKLSNGSYGIQFCLSATSSDIGAGINCATPNGIVNGACNLIFNCGKPLKLTTILGHACNTGLPDIDTCIYGTVKIGDQCWMEPSLNIGTNDPSFSDDTKLEKNYISPSNGSLYTWAEAMALPSACNSSNYTNDLETNGSDCGLGGQTYKIESNHQGICPDGWHIPSDEEIDHLMASSTDGICNFAPNHSWSCAGVGDKLKQIADCSTPGAQTCGATGFNFVLSGFEGGGYGDNGYMWSAGSSENPSYQHYYRVSRTVNAVFRDYSDHSTNFSIHCLKN